MHLQARPRSDRSRNLGREDGHAGAEGPVFYGQQSKQSGDHEQAGGEQPGAGDADPAAAKGDLGLQKSDEYSSDPRAADSAGEGEASPAAAGAVI